MEEEGERIRLLERICIMHDKELQRFIFSLTRNDQFAVEEIYQNTMEGALRGLEYLRDIKKMKSWIFAIAKAEARRYYAANSVAEGCGCNEKCSYDIEYLVDFTKQVENVEYLKSLIGVLTNEEQQLNLLYYIYGLPLKKISTILNLNYNTIRSMHMRSMAKMKKQSDNFK